MPLLPRSSRSKRDIAQTTGATTLSGSTSPLPAPAPAQLVSPYQLELSLTPPASSAAFTVTHAAPPNPARTATGSSSSTSSSGATTETAPTTTGCNGSDVSLDHNRWSVLDVNAAEDTKEVANGRTDYEERKRLRKKSSTGSVKEGLKGFFSGRRRSSSRGDQKAKEREKEEIVPPVPSLPPSIGLLDLSLPSLDYIESPAAAKSPNGAIVGAHGLPTPSDELFAAPSSPVSSTLAEGDDLTSLLHLVHAAGDQAFVDEDVVRAAPYVPPASQPAIKPFSLASCPSTLPSSRSPSVPQPVYSSLSHLTLKGNKPPASPSLPSPRTASKPPLLGPTTTPVPQDSDEDSYGAELQEVGTTVSSSPGTAATPPRLTRSVSSYSSPGTGTLRRRPLGPRATELLSLTLSRLYPSQIPSSTSLAQPFPDGALSAPTSTHPASAVRAAEPLRQTQTIARTLGRLVVLSKLRRGITMLETLEIEAHRSSVSPYFDARASVISKSARMSVLSTDSGDGEMSGIDKSSGKRDLEVWESEYAKLAEGVAPRRVPDDESNTPPRVTPLPFVAGSGAAIPLPRLKEWVARPSFLERKSETRVMYLPLSFSDVPGGSVEAGIVTDVVRPSRVGEGGLRMGNLKVSAQVKGLARALEGHEGADEGACGEGTPFGRPKREKKPWVGLLSLDHQGGGAILPALRAAAMGAARPPSMPATPDLLRRTSDTGGAGTKKLLLPGPLLRRVLAEEGQDDVDARREEARERLERRSTSNGEEEEHDDEDDRPLGHIQQQYRASLPPSPRRIPSIAPIRTSHIPASALAFAQDRVARLESEVARLKAREVAATQREDRLRREQAEREISRARERREKDVQRRLAEQSRRSRLANEGVAPANKELGDGSKGARRSSALPLFKDQTPSLYSAHEQQNFLAAPALPTFAVPISVAVPIPFDHVPSLASSAPNLQQLQGVPMSTAPSPGSVGLPRSASRQPLLPPAPVPTQSWSPPRQAVKEGHPLPSSLRPPSASHPHLPLGHFSSPSTLTSKRQSSHALPPAPHLSHSPTSPPTPTSKRVSVQPYLSPPHIASFAAPPPAYSRSRSTPMLVLPPSKDGEVSSPKPMKTGGAAFLGVQGGRRREVTR
ncbi:hypothetical protein JCM11251_006928 [Rhodosporidiobolus azoricus]